MTELEPYRMDDVSDHPWAAWAEAEAQAGGRLPGAVSRWNAKKDLSWEALRPDLVVEVAYDHMEGTRFRHTAQFRRWRPDRDPRSCTYEQLDQPVRFDLAEVLRAGRVRPQRASALSVTVLPLSGWELTAATAEVCPVYDIVVLVEQAVTDWDARQIAALHHDPPEPVHHHVLMPVEDAASRVEATIGSLAASEVMGTAALPRRVRPRAGARGDPRGQRERARLVDRRLQPGRRGGQRRADGDRPADRLATLVAERQSAEVVILTRAHIVAELLHVDWTHRARRKLKVPVLHLLAREPDWESEAEDQDAQEAREENGTVS